MNTVISIIIIFGALVFFHELGHLLLAKRAGILCREFAIGFGPKIFTIKKGETVYTIRLLPLGGFVRMAGEDPEMIELKPGQRVGLLFNDQNKVEKIVINQKSAYPNLKEVTVEEADLERGLYIKGYEDEDEPATVFHIDETSHYVMDGSEFQIAPFDRQFGSKSLWDRFLAIFAGPVMNFLLAIVIFITLGLLQGTPTSQVKEVVEGSPAEQAGMMNGDVITEINGTEITGWNKMTSIIQDNANNQLGFKVDREGESVSLSITPEKQELSENQSVGRIGVSPEYQVDFLDSIVFGFTSTYEFGKAIFVGLGQLVTGQLSIDAFSGPVGIYSYTEEAASGGLYVLMRWAGFLSINLGIFNLLPLPALDGGRLLFIGVEALRGKPIDPQKESLVHFIGFSFLMLLMLVVTWNDIQRFFL
ncbi:RIP metalloprotease RseP [Alkalihalobacillus hwajinpoensis]|uniref:RIP metalloprotease RseP n=1 Tax=Guptibacillus hwajinpoensis TaxID=208199 RepID=UPI001883B65E|nr:RIP metalloprotease RseP [Pseudalkalibacillus hwajinpoensis]MBF0708448.1 RIP metalloprotease RseP [Pseudalkalibacillus hwajinpoensis]